MACEASAGPRRVADLLFRRDMAGPSLGQIAASMTGLVLVEKLCMELLLPAWVPTLEAYQAAMGTLPFAAAAGALVSFASFWGVGTLLALPAFLRVERWKIQANRTLDFRALRQSMPLIVFNFLLATLAVPLCLYATLPEAAFDWRRLPDTSTLARDAVVWFAAEEILFFYVHRWLHENKKLYGAIHKIHHTWTAPVSYVAIYAHPLEHLISNIMPLIAGPIICGSHVGAVGIYIALGLMHTCAVHSGYWVCDDNGMHDEHHAKFNCNYGVVGILDYLYGSYQLPPGASGLPPPPSSNSASKKGKGHAD